MENSSFVLSRKSVTPSDGPPREFREEEEGGPTVAKMGAIFLRIQITTHHLRSRLCPASVSHL